MTGFCLVCERATELEKDAFGDPLPLCGCPEPAAVERVFDPVTGRFVDEREDQDR